jgi:hypothetical protein
VKGKRSTIGREKARKELVDISTQAHSRMINLKELANSNQRKINMSIKDNFKKACPSVQ